MHLDGRNPGRLDRILQRDGGMGIGGGVQDNAVLALCRALNGTDQLTLVIALEKIDLHPERLAMGAGCGLDIGERGASIDFRLAAAKQVQVRPVDDND